MTSTQWHGGELRWDHLGGEWTILAPGRAQRRADGTVTACPFCPGPSEDTPPETWRLPGTTAEAWRVRAVHNRYALSGQHEVILESPRHDWDLAHATDAEVVDVLTAWQARHRALRDDSAQVVIFRNRGAAAGTSLSHPHSQAVGLPVLSAVAGAELAAMRKHYARTGRPFVADLLSGELSAGDRVVLADSQAVAYCPFASVTEFEVRIAPIRHRADFGAVPADELRAVARMLRRVLAALRDELTDPAYNLILHTAPTGLEEEPSLSWWLRVHPRLAVPAGLELATGVPVSTVLPEEAAKRLTARVTD